MRHFGRHWLWVIAPALATVLATTVPAQRAQLTPAARARLDSAITRFMVAQHVPGLAASAVSNGEIVWAKGFGQADLENLVAVTPQTLFRLASVSKPLTAIGAMQLWEAGKLDLDAPIGRYCPSFPAKPWPITTRELLGHLGGIRHYRSASDNDLEIANTRHFSDPIDGGLSFFAADSLVAPPGTRFNYTTHGYTVVGCVIQGASGEPYVDYMRQHVFTPAGMLHTALDDRYAIIPHRTRFYHRDSTGHVVNAGLLDNSYKVPGGGWLSSANDLAKFEIAVLHDVLVRRPTRAVAWTEQHTTAGAPTSYGLGWGIDTSATPRRVAHGGGQQGTSTYILLAPDADAGIVVLANLDDVDEGALSKDLLAIILAARTEGH
jgi:serine beta-lactamase-like protein LACTB, mitochondrial